MAGAPSSRATAAVPTSGGEKADGKHAAGEHPLRAESNAEVTSGKGAGYGLQAVLVELQLPPFRLVAWFR